MHSPPNRQFFVTIHCFCPARRASLYRQSSSLTQRVRVCSALTNFLFDATSFFLCRQSPSLSRLVFPAPIIFRSGAASLPYTDNLLTGKPTRHHAPDSLCISRSSFFWIHVRGPSSSIFCIGPMRQRSVLFHILSVSNLSCNQHFSYSTHRRACLRPTHRRVFFVLTTPNNLLLPKKKLCLPPFVDDRTQIDVLLKRVFYFRRRHANEFRPL